jgi:hypothetical protein
VWFLIRAWAVNGRTRKQVTFAVEARGPLSAMRQVYALGYPLVLDDGCEPPLINLAQSFGADYRLPLDCGGSCALPPSEATGNLS